MVVIRVAWMTILMLLMLVTAGSGQTPVADPVSASTYRIGPRDVLDIRVFEVPELSSSAALVDENGRLQLPLIGEVDVAGLTANQVAERLRTILEEKYVQRASVIVEVSEFRSRPISVIGAVQRPGNLADSGRWTLLEAIAASGGLSGQHGDRILVLRRADNGLSDQIIIYIDDLMIDAKPEYNISVFAGDLINIPATFEITLFCLGEVNRPGAVTFRSTERLTLLSAISRAGGLTDRASNKVVIRRQSRDGQEEEIEVDYKKVVSGDATDPPLQASDVVVVKESFF